MRNIMQLKILTWYLNEMFALTVWLYAIQDNAMIVSMLHLWRSIAINNHFLISN